MTCSRCSCSDLLDLVLATASVVLPQALHQLAVVGRIRDLDRMTGKTFVFFNNCHAGQAVRGAKRMQQLLGIPLTGEEAPTLEL